MAIELKIGESLPLSLLLEDGASDKFPIAIVYDQANNPIPGSPFQLEYFAQGRYINYSFTVTQSYQHLRAVYIVYEDSGYTLQSYYGLSEDEFDILNSSGSGLPITFLSSVPEEMELPTSASKAYRIQATVFDAAGFPFDPDSLQIMVSAKTTSNVGWMMPQYMIRNQVGVYYYNYIVNSSDPEQVLVFEFDFTIGGQELQYFDDTEVIGTRAQIAALEVDTAAITAIENAINAQTSKLMFTGNLIQSVAESVADKSGYSITTANISQIVSAVWNEMQTSHTTPGSFGFYLNGQISLLQTAALALSQYSALAKETDLLSVLAQTNKMNFSGNNILAEAAVIDDKNGYSITSGNIATIAAAVWDQLKSAHTIAGSFGAFLDTNVSSMETEANASSRFNATAKETDLLSVAAQTNQMQFLNGNILANAAVVQDKFNYGLTVTERETIVNLIWNEAIANHLTNGTTGYYLSLVSSFAGESPSAIATAVWNAARNANDVAGSFGEALQGVLSASRASNLDNLNAPVNTLQTLSAAASQAAAAMTEQLVIQSALTAAQVSINHIVSILGTPSTTIAGDIASVSAGFPPSVGTEIAQILANTATLLTNLGTPSSTVSAEIASLLTKIGAASPDLTTQIQDAITAIQQIPTNPLLTTDTRLNNLDVAVSTRATASDIANAISGISVGGGAESVLGIVFDQEVLVGEVE